MVFFLKSSIPIFLVNCLLLQSLRERGPSIGIYIYIYIMKGWVKVNFGMIHVSKLKI